MLARGGQGGGDNPANPQSTVAQLHEVIGYTVRATDQLQ